MIEFLKHLMKDKEGNYSLREGVTLIFVAAALVSWIAQQFFGIIMPEYMFYSFVGLISAGCFGYSIERKTASPMKDSPPLIMNKEQPKQ